MRTALVLVLVALCSGCSWNDDDAGYERSMRSAVAELAEVWAEGIGLVDVDDDREAAALLERMADGVERVATSMARIDAPNDVAEEHDRVVAALGRSVRADRARAAELRRPRRIKPRSGPPDRKTLERLVNETLRSAEPPGDLDAALRAIERAGHDIGWEN